MRPLVCPFMFFSMTTLWVLASPTNILEADPRCYTFMVGLLQLFDFIDNTWRKVVANYNAMTGWYRVFQHLLPIDRRPDE